MLIHFTSLGCARNLVDSEVMLGILLKAGYEATDRPEIADYLVVNTCGFLEESRKESCDAIESLLEGRKKGAKVVVTGCMVQKHAGLIKEKFPDIHYLLGSGDVEKILGAIQSEGPGSEVTSARSYLQQGEVPRQLSTPKHMAYLKIAEGCAKRCSFCIIPTIKGPLRSKPQEQILKEFRLLLNQGVFEVILIAQDLGDYGKERRERPARRNPAPSGAGQGKLSFRQESLPSENLLPFEGGVLQKQGLESLIRALLQEKGDFWLRFLYLYPDEISEELVSLMEQDKRICPYLDMPIQHVNNEMLKAMRRKTSKEQIMHTIEMLRTRIPGVVIRTSLMVGFPGETEEQFEEMVEFVQKVPLDNVGIFKYSLEKESHSAKLPGHISEEVKQERFEKLAKTQHKMVAKKQKNYLGKQLQVLVEGYHPESNLLMRGRFYGQCPEIDGQVIINDGRAVTAFGQLYPVEITDVAGYDLIGKVIPSKKRCLNVVSS